MGVDITSELHADHQKYVDAQKQESVLTKLRKAFGLPDMGLEHREDLDTLRVK